VVIVLELTPSCIQTRQSRVECPAARGGPGPGGPTRPGARSGVVLAPGERGERFPGPLEGGMLTVQRLTGALVRTVGDGRLRVCDPHLEAASEALVRLLRQRAVIVGDADTQLASERRGHRASDRRGGVSGEHDLRGDTGKGLAGAGLAAHYDLRVRCPCGRGVGRLRAVPS
jgi:hypothetical protein